MFIQKYKTPKKYTNIIMSSDGEYLTGLWFEKSKKFLKTAKKYEEKKLDIFEKAIKWLDIYFSGKNPDFIPQYKLENLTPFRSQVLEIVNEIPYGQVTTYNDIARKIAKVNGMIKMSAQAVGGAVGWNPICIIIPCHRVIGTNGSLTGYRGGMKNKIELLKLENNDMSKFVIPKTVSKNC